MSKLSEMDATIKELRDIAASINDIANWLTGAFSADTEPEADAAPAPTTKEPEPVLAFEDVRAILADKSREGFTAQIRELLQKYAVRRCYYGHIHGKGVPHAFNGWIGCTEFRLVSADSLQFVPELVLP